MLLNKRLSNESLPLHESYPRTMKSTALGEEDRSCQTLTSGPTKFDGFYQGFFQQGVISVASMFNLWWPSGIPAQPGSSGHTLR